MCKALTRDTGEATEATIMAAINASHGSVSGVCHCGSRREATTTVPHAANATRIAASSDVIDWRGKRTSGSVSSNGAAKVSRATPPNKKMPGVPIGTWI